MDLIEIVLRPWTSKDLEALRGIYRSSRDLESQFPHPVSTLAQAQDVIEGPLACTEASMSLAITVDGQPVGGVSVSHLDRRHDTGWLSYFSATSVRGQGLTRRSVIAIANWALTELGLFRLELGHRVDNPASGAVALAAGFVPEGLERQKLRYGDDRFDVAVCARLATDPVPAADGVRVIPPGSVPNPS